MPFLLEAGHPAPTQQSGVTCGGACLVVARMTVDPRYAELMTAGDAETRRRRFADEERAATIRADACAVRGRGVLTDLGWPRALGTSPWGARAELERGTGRRYDIRLLRHGVSDAELEESVRVSPRPAAPALLYVGDRVLPRHVTLLTTRGSETLVYEPTRGAVTRWCRGGPAPWVGDATRLHFPWFVIAPAADFLRGLPMTADIARRNTLRPIGRHRRLKTSRDRSIGEVSRRKAET